MIFEKILKLFDFLKYFNIFFGSDNNLTQFCCPFCLMPFILYRLFIVGVAFILSRFHGFMKQFWNICLLLCSGLFSNLQKTIFAKSRAKYGTGARWLLKNWLHVNFNAKIIFTTSCSESSFSKTFPFIELQRIAWHTVSKFQNLSQKFNLDFQKVFQLFVYIYSMISAVCLHLL